MFIPMHRFLYKKTVSQPGNKNEGDETLTFNLITYVYKLLVFDNVFSSNIILIFFIPFKLQRVTVFPSGLNWLLGSVYIH